MAIHPVKDVVKSPNMIPLLVPPFLYPVLFGIFQLLWRRARRDVVRQVVAQALYGALFALGAWLVSGLMDQYRENRVPPVWEQVWTVFWVGIWASLAIRLRPITAPRLLRRLAVAIAAYAFWVIGALLETVSERLLGGWLALAASAVAVLTYLAERRSGRRVAT